MTARPTLVLAPLVAMLGLVAVDACSSDEPNPAAPDAGATNDAAPCVPDAAGDAPSGTAKTFYKSGTRLRAEVVGTGEARVFERWFDTKRNETCDYVQTQPGEYRCLPSHSFVRYSDPTCADASKIAFLDPCTKKFEYVVLQQVVGGATCTREVFAQAIFSLGAALGEGDIYEKADEGCIPSSPAPEVLRHALGAEIPLTEFAKATTVRVDVGPDLSVERLIGEDGSELFTSRFEDRTRDAGCSPWRLGSKNAEANACLPSALGIVSDDGSRWANATCTEPASVASRGPGCPPVAAIVRRSRVDAGADAGTCSRPEDFEDSVFSVGAPLTTIYRGESCTPEATDAGAYVGLGSELPATGFPGLERVLAGTGRVRLRALANAGTQVDVGTLFDDVSKTFCSAQPFADGKLYCLPGDIVYREEITSFKDAACTQPIITASPCSGRLRTVIGGSVTCEGGAYDATVRPLGEPFELATYYNKFVGCEPVQNDLGLAYDVLPAVPVSAHLAEVTRTQD